MPNVIVTNGSVSHEYYVLQINGRVTSIHRRYQDAVGAGLQLKHQFPSDDIKVSVRNSPDELDNILHLESRLISGRFHERWRQGH